MIKAYLENADKVPMFRLCLSILIFTFVAPILAQDSTSNGVQVESPAAFCHPPPQLQESMQLGAKVVQCGSAAIAAGSSIVANSGTMSIAGLAIKARNVAGRALFGGAISAGIVGSIYGLGALAKGANSIEKCRVHGMGLKNHVIEVVNRRGVKVREALEKAGFVLSEADKRRLQFPPAYRDQERLKHKLCGEMILLGEQIKQRQSRVFLSHTNGTMKTIPFPQDEEEVFSDREYSMMQAFSESLKCLPKVDYVWGLCALGNFVLYRKGLPDLSSRGEKTTVRSSVTKDTVVQSQPEVPVASKSIKPLSSKVMTAKEPRRAEIRKPKVKPSTTQAQVDPSLEEMIKRKIADQQRVENAFSRPVPQAKLAFSQRATGVLKPLSGRSVSPLEAKLKNGKIIESKKAEQGLQGAKIVRLSTGVKAVWKPHTGKIESNYRAEVFAYELDRKLGLNLVPPTVEYRVGGQVGSMQLFRRGKDAMERRVDSPHQLHKQSTFDYLIDHRDRHRHNYMTSSNGRLISIDNTDSMTGKSGLRGRDFDDRMVEMALFLRTNEGQRVVTRLKAVRDGNLRGEIKEYFGEKDTKAFMERVERILELSDQIK